MKGFIFDMDGTMVDNMMVHHRAWQRLLAENGLELNLDEIKATIHGKNEEILFRLFGDVFTAEQCHELALEKERRYREIFKPDLALIEGLDDFLKQATEAGIPMGIGTAAPPENVRFVLENLPIGHYFTALVDSSMVTQGKPNPQVFQMVAEGIGVDASDCIVFEDSPTGVRTALNAGCKTVVVLTTHTMEEFQMFPNVIRYIRDFTEISPGDFM